MKLYDEVNLRASLVPLDDLLSLMGYDSDDAVIHRRLQDVLIDPALGLDADAPEEAERFLQGLCLTLGIPDAERRIKSLTRQASRDSHDFRPRLQAFTPMGEAACPDYFIGAFARLSWIWQLELVRQQVLLHMCQSHGKAGAGEPITFYHFHYAPGQYLTLDVEGHILGTNDLPLPPAPPVKQRSGNGGGRNPHPG